MIGGVWVPLITPFKDGLIDLVSYRRLIEHAIAAGASGLFPLGTTGEAPTLACLCSSALAATPRTR
jgi:4-hydroxy-tetrahydrodipicolinate synthase